MTPSPIPSRAEQDAARVVAVVVSYNRRELLEGTLAGIAGGALVPDRVVVVDNASTDGTGDWLAGLDYPLPLDVVPLARNVGGAGGFAVGIDRALHRHAADLVWVMDDDTEPLEDTLAEAVRTWRDYAPARLERPVFVASRVLWTDGRDHPMNSMRERILPGARRRRAAAAVGGRTIRSGSFVSLLMDAEAMRRTHLPITDYFIWNDDFEYSTRLARFRDAVWAPASVVRHHTRTFGTTDTDPGPRFYNDVRNKLWVFGRSQSLAPWEKVLYSGATARLWIRTLRNSQDRPALAGHLVRGVRDALRPPRPDANVLAGVWDLDRHALPGEPDAEPRPQPEVEGFSVLMPVYAGDTPAGLRRAFASNAWEQTLPPQQIVVVADGPLGEDLDTALDELVARAQTQGIRTDRVGLPEHAGLPEALNLGLRHCLHPVVARADADDASVPERFALQVPRVAAEEFDVLGSAMVETDEDLGTVAAVREVDTDPDRIAAAMAWRNPLCHPTVVFDREAVQAAGGYEDVPGAEDYVLWARLLARGARLGNLAEPLVRYRSGAANWRRRGGPAAARREARLQRRLRAAGFVGAGQFARNLVVRCGYRLVPTGLRRGAYRRLIGRRPGPARTTEKGTTRA